MLTYKSWCLTSDRAERRRQREAGELLQRECPSKESCREYGPYLVGNLGPEGTADDSDDGGSWHWLSIG